jgi:multidrug efflux pump subunit AcrA (membrane-fusion protein)
LPVEGWKSLFDIATVVLLFLTFAAGAGVLFTGNIINRAQGEKLHKFDSDLTKAKSELAVQQERAAKAEANIGVAEQHAAEANTKAEGFRLDIAKANEASARAQAQVAGAAAEAAKATDRAAEATKAAEAEKIERLKLEAQIAPRRLTTEQMRAIASRCQKFKGRTVSVISYALDSEGAILGKQLIAVFGASGILVQDGTASSSPLGGFSIGIHVTGSDQELATLLRQTLSVDAQLGVAPPNSEGGGAQFEMRTGPSGPAPDATVLVGVKPIK